MLPVYPNNNFDDTTKINQMRALLNRPPLDPPPKPKPITKITFTESKSPCEALVNESDFVHPMDDLAALASMSHAEITQLCRKNLAASFYTDFADLPAIAVYDRAIDAFMYQFADPTGLSACTRNSLAAAHICDQLGIWARSYLAACRNNDIELMTKCVQVAAYYIAAIVLGSKGCVEAMRDE